MAEVRTLLNNIKNAIYGKDVRKSIHDAIEQCYYDGKAGGNDLEARDRAAAAEARMDTFTSLKNGSTTGDAELADIRIGINGQKYANAGTAVREQIRDTHTIEVTDVEPTRDNTQLWINPEERDVFYIPEVNDDETSDVDTWSSKRITDVTSSVDIKWTEYAYVAGPGYIVHDKITDPPPRVRRMLSNLIPCPEGIEVSFIGETNHENISSITFYDANKTVISANPNIGENGVEHTIVSPPNTAFLRLSSATSIGWSLKFSDSPVFKFLEEYAYKANRFDLDVNSIIAYNHIINGVNQKPSFINRAGVTIHDDGTVVIAPGGYYFLSFAYGAFGGNAYVGIKSNRNERIVVGFSENGTTTLTGAPMLYSEPINGYEIIKVDKLDEYDYPYGIVRIDNREHDDELILYDVRIVDGEMPLPNKPSYVSVDGSDNGDGSLENPFATVNEALISGSSNIYILPGIYEQTINLQYAQHCDVNISSYIPDGRVIFRDPIATISTTETLVDGYTKVYSVPSDRVFGESNIWIFQEGIPDETTLISESERHPLQRGYKYRCEDTKIDRCSSIALGEALDEIENSNTYKWYYDSEASKIYFSRPSKITEMNPLCGCSSNSLFYNGNRNISLNISGIESKYLTFDISKTANSVIKDCKAINSSRAGAFLYNQVLSCEFIRCEAARCFTGPNGDGFNAHGTNTGDIYSKQVTVSLIDCWSHDNNDDGYSDHERSEITIIGGLFEYNRKGGVVPSYGSHCTCYNVYSRFNYAGFYYTGTIEEAEGGQYGQMYCHCCIAEGNNLGGTHAGFRVDGAYNSITLIGCKAIDNGTGYVIGNDLSTGKLVDCRASNNDKMTVGTFNIVNTYVVV